MCLGLGQIAIRQMLQDDDSLTMMLFFGCVGFLNAVCLAPVLIILRISGFVQTAGLTLRILGLTVCKGAAAEPMHNQYGDSAPQYMALWYIMHAVPECRILSRMLCECDGEIAVQVSLTMYYQTTCGPGRCSLLVSCALQQHCSLSKTIATLE